jgi:hypothetical protein
MFFPSENEVNAKDHHDGGNDDAAKHFYVCCHIQSPANKFLVFLVGFRDKSKNAARLTHDSVGEGAVGNIFMAGEADADALASIVAGNTGLMGYSGTDVSIDCLIGLVFETFNVGFGNLDEFWVGNCPDKRS